MAKPFGDAVKGLKKGEMTATPVQTQFGWHVIKLEDTRETTPPPFDQVKQQVTNGVMQKKLQAYVDSLKKNAKIEKTPLSPHDLEERSGLAKVRYAFSIFKKRRLIEHRDRRAARPS